jgi:hypothetical protein
MQLFRLHQCQLFLHALPHSLPQLLCQQLLSELLTPILLILALMYITGLVQQHDRLLSLLPAQLILADLRCVQRLRLPLPGLPQQLCHLRHLPKRLQLRPQPLQVSHRLPFHLFPKWIELPRL